MRQIASICIVGDTPCLAAGGRREPCDVPLYDAPYRCLIAYRSPPAMETGRLLASLFFSGAL